MGVPDAIELPVPWTRRRRHVLVVLVVAVQDAVGVVPGRSETNDVVGGSVGSGDGDGAVGVDVELPSLVVDEVVVLVAQG